MAQIYKKLLNVYWEFITENSDVNTNYDAFLLVFNIIINDCAPLRYRTK